MTDKSTTPQSKLEECARAAFDRHKYKYPERWEDLIPNIRESYIDDTRAVILCLMEPSEGMVAAGGTEIYGHPREKAMEWAKEEKFDSCAYEATDTFRAILQSVLDESKE